MDLPVLEEKVLRFWKKNKIFEKSLEKTKEGPKFIFYEGPPFANGKPGIHHLLARAFKDAILRYKTMRGFYVERKAGWDTHGLPTEIAAEKSLGIKTKKEIEKIGTEKFIKECEKNIFTYKKEWEEFTDRIGYWLDIKHPYITCSNDYIESLWWILKQIYQKGLLYQDYKVVPYCPRCGTSLSSHEVAQGYKSVKESAIYVRFKIQDPRFKAKNKGTYLLVWTTTPWTLPGNIAIAVNKDIVYAEIKTKERELLILAETRIKDIFKTGSYKVIRKFKGKDLLNLKYEPLLAFTKPEKSAYKIIFGDFVSFTEGTGLVHIAPAFGEDDMKVAKKNNLPVLMPVDEAGKFKKEIEPWAGMFVKDADSLIVDELKKKKNLFKEEMYEHDYPFCWRCNTPLLYYAKDSWFIEMTKVRENLLKNNRKVNWIPDYLKDGRFGEWLKDVKDWTISRERYWGTPLPIWKCNNDKCNHIEIIGSIKELRERSSESLPKNPELHKPAIDGYHFVCPKCGSKSGGGIMSRVPEVIDCWFDSGSMPLAQAHFPFAFNQIEKLNFPADFICEGIDQTRGWFYTLLAVSTLLDLGPSYKNVISIGIVLDDKGQKMSKSKGNIVKPADVINKFGADCARFYFYTINQTAEPKRFDFKDIQDLYRKFFGTLWNSYAFLETYAQEISNQGTKTLRSDEPINMGSDSKNLLDKWVISNLNNLIKKVSEDLEKYDVVSSARVFLGFIDDLSNWYIRRSRKRFQKPETEEEKKEAFQTLFYTLFNLIKLLAPFAPFISEEIYQKLKSSKKFQQNIGILAKDAPESVHLYDWPEPDIKEIDSKLEEKMKRVREITAEALSLRRNLGIKVRQPLSSLTLKDKDLAIKNDKELLNLIKEEMNVKKIIFDPKNKKEMILDAKITPKLREEGILREVIRQIQRMRKIAGYKPKHRVLVRYTGSSFLKRILAKNKKFILKEVIAEDFRLGEKPEKSFDVEREIKIGQDELWLAIKKL